MGLLIKAIGYGGLMAAAFIGGLNVSQHLQFGQETNSYGTKYSLTVLTDAVASDVKTKQSKNAREEYGKGGK